jgi:hypothetical protein
MNQHVPSTSRPGTMTSVMRAALPRDARKILRVALVRGGRVVEERWVRRGADVTVGPRETCTFTVVHPALPARLLVFEWTGSGYSLRLEGAISGRILDGETRIDVSDPQNREPIPLSVRARGRVTLADVSILFHFMDEPAPRPKPRLPLAVQRSFFADFDWKTTFIAAFSFLIHFGVVGGLYSDWADQVVDDGAVAYGPMLARVLAAPPVPTVELPQSGAGTEKARTSPEKKTSGEPTGGKARGGGAGKGRSGGAPGMSGNALSESLKQLDMEMLASLNRNGASTSRVLREGDIPLGNLERAARGAEGTGAGKAAGLDLSGTPMPFGGVRTGSRGLASIGNAGREGPAGSGAKAETKGPIGNAITQTPVFGGDDAIANVPRAVGMMSAGFRACYRRGLEQENPSMAGSVRISARVGPNGDVAGASPQVVSGNLSSTVIACLARRVESVTFEPASPATFRGATVVIPVILRTQ